MPVLRFPPRHRLRPDSALEASSSSRRSLREGGQDYGGQAATPGESRDFESAALAELDALYRAALRLTRNPVEADDLGQDTFVKAFRARGRFEAGTNMRAWLFTILMNTWRNRRRDAGRDPVDVDSDRVEHAAHAADETASPEELLLRSALDVDLKAALDRMAPTFREAVWLRDVEEFTYAEIARILDVPVGTVMSRISRGRRQLYDYLTAQGAAVASAGGGRG
jgi:RNA polymerase sigma-70 factor, ECF subfamily